MLRILISAGHTSMDPGAIFQDLREADLNRNIAKRIIPHLEGIQGVEVQAVPLDLPLFQRIEWINNTGYEDERNDILVEIHVNDADGSKRGVEAWYESNGDNHSQKLAATLVDHVTKEFDWESQGAKSEYDHELGMLTFLNRTKPAAVILETLFMDNEQDTKILRDDAQLEKLAKSIASGILKYFGKDEKGKDLAADQKPDFAKLIKDQVKSDPTKRKKNSLFNLPGLGGGLFGNNDNDDDFDQDTEDQDPPSPFPSFPKASPTSSPKPFGQFGGPNNNVGSMGGSSTTMMDREERKKMIEEYYVKILGRQPKPTDLNYFLNRGTSETELIKKMVDSQEHVDLIKAKKELDELNQKHEQLTSETSRLKAAVNDMRGILDSLNKAVMHKNKRIKELESIIYNQHGVNSDTRKLQQHKQPSVTKYVVPEDFSPKGFEKFVLDFIKRFS